MTDQRPPPLKPLTDDEQAFIRSFVRLIHGYPRALGALLDREQRISLSEYLTLMHLSEAPGRQLRMSDLACGCDLSLSGMTRIVDRLERDGFIERVQDAKDGRGANAVLTDAGLERLHQAWPTFLAGARRYLVDHLGDLPLREISAAFQAAATAADITAR
jgi:DNA-binding MarR family transcriptional regulator